VSGNYTPLNHSLPGLHAKYILNSFSFSQEKSKYSKEPSIKNEKSHINDENSEDGDEEEGVGKVAAPDDFLFVNILTWLAFRGFPIF
jgi:hypothetical protein